MNIANTRARGAQLAGDRPATFWSRLANAAYNYHFKPGQAGKLVLEFWITPFDYAGHEGPQRSVPKDCRIDWGRQVPDYFTHALEAEQVRNLKLRRFQGKAAHPQKDKALWVH